MSPVCYLREPFTHPLALWVNHPGDTHPGLENSFLYDDDPQSLLLQPEDMTTGAVRGKENPRRRVHGKPPRSPEMALRLKQRLHLTGTRKRRRERNWAGFSQLLAEHHSDLPILLVPG